MKFNIQTVNYLIDMFLVFLGVTVNINIIYLLFAIIVIEELFFNKKINKDFLLIVALYSIIIPDNYTTELFMLLFAVSAIKREKFNIYYLVLYIFCLDVMVSSLLNMVPTINILFSIASLLPVFLMYAYKNKSIDKNLINLYLYRVARIEIIATIFNFIFLRELLGEDWSCGTFSRSGGQQSQLLIIASLLAIYFIYLYYNDKSDRKNLFYGLSMLLIIVTTNSWLLTIALYTGVIVFCIINKLNRKSIPTYMTLIIVTVILFSNYQRILPESTANSISYMLSNYEYLRYRFYKLFVYKAAYIDIPGSDLFFLLFGNGIGYFSSRAALICTGYYTDFYSNYFSPSISVYTDSLILKNLQLAFNSTNLDYGSVLARPYSSWISLVGECGYIGVILFITLNGLFCKSQSNGYKLLVWSWLIFCLIENYFEYPKIITMLFILLAALRTPKELN